MSTLGAGSAGKLLVFRVDDESLIEKRPEGLRS